MAEKKAAFAGAFGLITMRVVSAGRSEISF
jgi:hypothetical protein